MLRQVHPDDPGSVFNFEIQLPSWGDTWVSPFADKKPSASDREGNGAFLQYNDGQKKQTNPNFRKMFSSISISRITI